MKEEQMTNEELNAACCEFAGLEPRRWAIQYKDGKIRELRSNPGDPNGTSWKVLGPVYPPVSTDWAAAGRLMDALNDKGEFVGIRIGGGVAVGWWLTPHGWECTEEQDAGPRALCLAVAALAAASGKEAGR